MPRPVLMCGDIGPVHARLADHFLVELSSQALELVSQVAGLSPNDSLYEQRRKAASACNLPAASVRGLTT